MKILITGSTGLIGSSLIPILTAKGHEITRLSRSRAGGSRGTVYWDPDRGEIDVSMIDGYDAVVHLAGENIAGRWTPEKKKKIVESRVRGTKLLSEALAGIAAKPRVIVSASGIGFYGDRGNDVLTEDSAHGDGFLARLGMEWEAALRPALQAGIRVVNMRLGIVLSPEGGALSKMLTPFSLGLGGKLGSGEQYWSWIAIDDVLTAIYHSLVTEGLHGPVNFTAPTPVTNAVFTATLGSVLKRPAFFHVPAFTLRALFGEMADETLLSSTRALPARLLGSGYEFRYPELRSALQHLLEKQS